MTHARRAYPTLKYDGTDISKDVEKYLTSFQYIDPASGESDSLSVTLGNWDNNWLGGWFPDKGALLTASIQALHWEKQEETLELSCGSFTLDDISFSGSPDILNIGAVSSPVDDAFKETERTKTWEDVTVEQIASDISRRYDLELLYDAPSIKIAAVEQSGTTDSSFMEKICKDYGLSLKVYSKKLVVFDRESYKAKPPAVTIDKGDMKQYQINTTLIGTYTGGELTYTTKDGQEITYKTGKGPRIFKANVSATTAAEAKLRLEAAIADANHGETTMSFSTIGMPLLAAGQTISVTGFGRLDGKYYIDKLTHAVGKDYTTSFECSKVQ